MAPGSGPELVQKLLHQGIKRPELKDELYMQLLKQSRGNTTPSIIKVPVLSQPRQRTDTAKTHSILSSVPIKGPAPFLRDTLVAIFIVPSCILPHILARTIRDCMYTAVYFPTSVDRHAILLCRQARLPRS